MNRLTKSFAAVMTAAAVLGGGASAAVAATATHAATQSARIDHVRPGGPVDVTTIVRDANERIDHRDIAEAEKWVRSVSDEALPEGWQLIGIDMVNLYSHAKRIDADPVNEYSDWYAVVRCLWNDGSDETSMTTLHLRYDGERYVEAIFHDEHWYGDRSLTIDSTKRFLDLGQARQILDDHRAGGGTNAAGVAYVALVSPLDKHAEDGPWWQFYVDGEGAYLVNTQTGDIDLEA